MAKVALEELRLRSDELRLKIDRLFDRYGENLALFIEDDPEQISLDDWIEKCRADVADDASAAVVDQIAALFTPFALSAADDDSDDLQRPLARARVQVAKGRSIVASFQRQTCSLWQMEVTMRAEVDALRDAAAEAGGAGAFAAEQKRLLVEKLLLFSLIMASLEEAKRCLLLAVEKLDEANFLLELLAGAAVDVNRQSRAILERIQQLNREAFQKDPTIGIKLSATDAVQLVSALEDQKTIDAVSVQALATVRKLRNTAVNVLLPKALGLQLQADSFAGLGIEVQRGLVEEAPKGKGPF